jgi:hypothetical protein
MKRIVTLHCVSEQRPHRHDIMAVKFTEVLGCAVRAYVDIYTTEI